MTWFKVDDRLHAHPKIADVPLRAMGLWVVSGSWAAAYETDGVVPASWVHRHQSVTGESPVTVLADELVDAGLWTTGAGGWVFHDWAQYQPTRAELEAERARKAQNARDSRAARSSQNGAASPARHR